MQPEMGFTILVVDDEVPTFELLARIGQQAFPEATFSNTSSPQETLRYLDQQPQKWPQLILLDIDFKLSMDGLALLPQLRSRFNGLVPTIMFTTSADEQHITQAYDTGRWRIHKNPIRIKVGKAMWRF